MRRCDLYILLLVVVLVSSLTAAQEDSRIELELAGLSPELAEDLRKTRALVNEQSGSDVPANERSEAWGSLGMIYHAQYMLFAAKDAYLTALSHQEDYRWRHLLAVILIGEGKPEEAIVHLTQATLVNPDYFPTWLRLGQLLMKQGDVEDAKQAFDHANRLSQDSAAVLVGLADVATSQRDWELAQEMLEKAWLQAPLAGQIAHKMMGILRVLGDESQLSVWAERAEIGSAEPASDDPLLISVSNMSRNGRFFAQAGDWAAARGDRVGAMAAYESATRVAPENVEYGVTYATMLYFAGQPGLAIEEAKRVISVDIENAKSWYSLAWILRKSPHPEQFVQGGVAIRRAIELEDRDEYRALAGALAMGGNRFAEAQTDYYELLSRNPDNAYYFYWFGMSRLADGSCDGREAISRAIALEPVWGEAHLVMTRADALCGDLGASERRLQSIVQESDGEDIRLAQAYVLLFKGDTMKGRELAEAELPHPDAQLIMDALDAGTNPTRLFGPGSPWWMPPELQ